MFRKYLLSLGVFVLAFIILSVSFLKSASVKYAFATPPTSPSPILGTDSPKIDYQLPFPGSIEPDSPLWGLKALRDAVWYWITPDTERKAELALLFADKRIVMSRDLFAKKKPELAFSTLTKAEKYLESAMMLGEKAGKGGSDTTNLLMRLVLSSLKHREVIDEVLNLAPEGARPGIIKMQDYSRDIYIKAHDLLNSKGIVAPKNPFNGP